MSAVDVPESLVKGVRALLARPRSFWLENPDALATTALETGVPVEWAKAFVERFFADWKSAGAIRLLSVRQLPPRRPYECSLCFGYLAKPAKTWHKDCWKAFEPHTARGWSLMRRAAFKRCKNSCEKCGKQIWKALRGEEGTYEVDHKLAIALGGLNELSNLQVLCLECHKDKSKEDNKKIREAKLQKKIVSGLQKLKETP